MEVSPNEDQIQVVKIFQILVSTAFQGAFNALCWKRDLEVDHPDSQVLPCLHGAPIEKYGQPRLLLIILMNDQI